MGRFTRSPSAWEKNRITGVCPECGAKEFTVLCQLYGWSYNGEGAAVSVIGFRLSCQRCPCVFSVSGQGSFRQHSKALPWTPSPVLMDEATKRFGEKVPLRDEAPPRPPGATGDPPPMRFPHPR